MNASQPVLRIPAPDPSWAIFLDVDGTLVDLARRPDEIEPRPELIGTLGTLRNSFPIALISGRRLSDLDRLIAPLRFPAAGQHGAERRSADGRIHLAGVSRGILDLVRADLSAWIKDRPGVVLEDKGLSLALHYRSAPHLERETAEMMGEAARRLGGAFVVMSGKKVVELKPSGHDKGSAIEAFLAEVPFMGRVPVFVGDDATDEEGFKVVNRLGGLSIKVGEEPTVARWRLASVSEVLEWLSRCVKSMTPTWPGG
jgi:trehalose 6-phosphate phosphatase